MISQDKTSGRAVGAGNEVGVAQRNGTGDKIR